MVGAPYEENPLDPESSGAIYVYLGREKLNEIKLSQKIYASNIQVPAGLFLGRSRALQGFGFSLSGGIDMDASGYPDLAVGAHKSNTVVLLRSLPIVYVDSFVGNAENLLEIDQTRKECRKDDGTELVCFNFDLCFRLNEKKVNNTNRFIQV